MSPGDVSPVEPPKWHKNTARALHIPPGPTLPHALAGSLLTPLRAGEHSLERTSCCLVTQVHPTLCDRMDCSTSDPPFLHHLPALVQTHVHWVGDAIQPSHPWSPPLLPLPSILPNIMLFSDELTLCIRWAKYWSFSISPSNEYSGLISFRIDWFDLLAVQGILKSLPPAPQFKNINYPPLSLLYSLIVTFVYAYGKNHSCDCVDSLHSRSPQGPPCRPSPSLSAPSIHCLPGHWAPRNPHRQQTLENAVGLGGRRLELCKESMLVKMVEQKDVFSSSPARTPKLQLAAEQPSMGGCWNPPKKKDTPYPRTNEKPQDGKS